MAFELPDAAALAEHLGKWFQSRKVQLDGEVSLQRVLSAIGQQSIANAEAVAQTALNRAVSRRQTPVSITTMDLQQAVRMVLG